jgi:hypothetical protein
VDHVWSVELEFWPYKYAFNLKLGQGDVTSLANFMCLLHMACIFQLYLEFVWRNISVWSNHCWFMIQGQSWSVSMAHLWLFFQENWVPRGKLQLLGFFHYNFWHIMSTLNDISSCIGTHRGLVLVYVVLRPAKQCLGFLIELIEQVIHTIKFGEIRLYAHNGALREFETSQEKSETLCWRSCCVD